MIFIYNVSWLSSYLKYSKNKEFWKIIDISYLINQDLKCIIFPKKLQLQANHWILLDVYKSYKSLIDKDAFKYLFV